MMRQYVQVTDEQRRELVRLIHDENYSIARASKATGIPYDNAKAINRTYLRESRLVCYFTGVESRRLTTNKGTSIQKRESSECLDNSTVAKTPSIC